jgi:Spy/CpxP family protein refolding chaperone
LNTWKVILATMVIFGTGVVTGGLVVQRAWHIRFHQPQHMPGSPRASQPGGPGGPGMEFLRHMERELDLAPDQREQVDKVLKQSQERSRKIMEPVAGLIREESRRREAEFRALLTPEQQVRFDEGLKQVQKSREPRRPQPPHERPADASGAAAGSTNR